MSGYGSNYSEIDNTAFSPDESKSIRKKANHNETEKRRIKNISKAIDDMRDILDQAGIDHKADKVSTVDAIGTYLKSLIKERDTLVASIGYFDKVLNDGEDTPATEEVYHHFTPSPFQINLKEEDYKPIVKKPIEVPEKPVDPSRYAGHSLMKRILEAEKEQQQQQQQQDKKENDECEECCEKISSNDFSFNYRDVWMKTNFAIVVVDVDSGRLIKGNSAFMKLFHFTSNEEINHLTLFDIVIVKDLSTIWNEYCQIITCTHANIRSFDVVVTNRNRSIRFPCLLTMGPVMNIDGSVSQIEVSFTPLKTVNPEVEEEIDVIGNSSASLEKLD